MKWSQQFQIIIQPPSSVVLRDNISWSPPPLGWLKVNTDGTTKGNLGDSSGGAFIRDDQGQPMTSKAFNFGKGSNKKSKSLAILKVCNRAPPPPPSSSRLHHCLNPLLASDLEVETMGHNEATFPPFVCSPFSFPPCSVVSPFVVAPNLPPISLWHYMEDMEVSSLAGDFTIPEVLLGLTYAYPNSPSLSCHNSPSKSVAEGKKMKFEDKTIADNVISTEHPLDDVMEVFGFIVVGANEDQGDTITTEDSRIDTAKLLQR
ncbi:hypothetical protein KI387_005025, partial [Taxus chinensis]